ncbi:hypothetical protein NADFUDRAFT_45065 [Nadsonia fulvescens var. elongata DSM 6958]|uniref:Autophagy-related protein n=1 Tax=Nadsonia fulvescens var. elongata DSM 6958 TaxID=857566 RepID=A0A1E3PTD7_9ASCO|nr:hypothetical protein NADFUDRAFT_45065 [Nadsonia fulvescens var. elongata DSM 6958]
MLSNEESDPTSARELAGWYSYSWAAEPFMVSVVGTYVPILLEQFARYNGVLLADHLTPCMSTSSHNITDDPTSPLPFPGDNDTNEAVKCVVKVFGSYIDTSSFALYTFSISVLIQTLVVISMSGAADRGNFKKRLLIAFSIMGSLSTCCFVFVKPSRFLIASLLAIISNSTFGAVSVCGNSFLPVLVDNHPAVIEEKQKLESLLEQDQSSEEVPVILHHYNSLMLVSNKVSSKISGFGIAVGYLSAFIVQIGTVLVIFKMRSSLFSIQVSIALVGLWWLIFQIPVIILLKSRPGPVLPANLHSENRTRTYRLLMLITNGGWAYICFGWRTIYSTFRDAKRMKDVVLFLITWFIISDAATTINSAAVLFARTQLDMDPISLAIIGLLVVVNGILGAILIPRIFDIKKRYPAPIPETTSLLPESDALSSSFPDSSFSETSPATAMSFVILIMAVIPLYGIVGFFTSAIGLTRPWEMYMLAVWYGFALGGLNTLARSTYSILIPKGRESIFFSLFSITDKGSSILGPMVIGLIIDKTHNIRYSFYFFLVLLMLAFVVMKMVDFERGASDAKESEMANLSD